MSNLDSAVAHRTTTFLFYDIMTIWSFFKQFTDDAVIIIQFLKWVAEKQNTFCAAIVSTMDENASRLTVPVAFSTLLTSTRAALVYFGTKQI